MNRPDGILKTLREAGFAAYYVGGCVRDTLLGRPIHDWDICTAALPEQTMALFPACYPSGLQHGTVTVLDGGSGYEVTTFRQDGSYLDGRHPESVTFVGRLEDDLARRDFTVNAMAMDESGRVTDLFGGRADLAARQLRCVGSPAARFGEDALRMLRALRFSAQLGFTVEPQTYAAIRACAPLCAALSAERVRDEVEKTLLSDDPQAVSEMCRLGLLTAVGLSGAPDLTALSALPRERTVRWAGLFRACPNAFWESFRLDRRTGAAAQSAAALAGFSRDTLGWKRLAAARGMTLAAVTAALQGESETVAKIAASGDCLSLAGLAVSGADFPALHGPAVGKLLQALLDHVLRHPADNERQTLLRLADSFPSEAEI